MTIDSFAPASASRVIHPNFPLEQSAMLITTYLGILCLLSRAPSAKAAVQTLQKRTVPVCFPTTTHALAMNYNDCVQAINLMQPHAGQTFAQMLSFGPAADANVSFDVITWIFHRLEPAFDDNYYLPSILRILLLPSPEEGQSTSKANKATDDNVTCKLGHSRSQGVLPVCSVTSGAGVGRTLLWDGGGWRLNGTEGMGGGMANATVGTGH
ncbi:hypothetical protein MMC21_003272 [Puttea exsequens]|nr:hypothetical protein [Puttea exsequens]